MDPPRENRSRFRSRRPPGRPVTGSLLVGVRGLPVVVATCKEEARLLGLLWIAEHLGKTTVDLRTSTRVREADQDTVERWLAVRAQEATLMAQLRGSGT